MANTSEEKKPASDSVPFPGIPDFRGGAPFPPPYGMSMPPMPQGMMPGSPAGMYPMMPPPPGSMMPGAMASPVSTSSVFDSLGTMLKLGIDTINTVLAGGNQLIQGISGQGYHMGYHGCHGYGHHGHHCCEHHHYHDSYGHSCCDVCGDSCCHPSVHNCG